MQGSLHPETYGDLGEERSRERLDSWKEVAAYLKRQVRTVQLWEKREGLPIHRHLHSKLGTVYAYKSEIDAWWEKRCVCVEDRKDGNGGKLAVPALGARRPSARKIMLAVLPFENLSRDPGQEYFSDGLTEEMITQVGRLYPERLGVIARTSAMNYKGAHRRIDDIGRELGVEYILEGCVRRDADRVRINAQLVQVSDQTHLWADSFDRRVSDIFALQSEVAGCIARALAVELLPTQKEALGRVPTTSSEAHSAYLKGRYYWNRRTTDSLRKAIEYFEQAVARDPNYAMAYAGLADSQVLLVEYGGLPPKEAMPRAKAAAQKALDIDETLAEGHASLALVEMYYDWDCARAEKEFRQAIALNGNYATAHEWYADCLSAMQRHEEAIAESEQAQVLDPLSLIIHADLGWILFSARQYERAIGQCEKVLEMDPNFWFAHWVLGCCYSKEGRYDQAVAELEEAVALSGKNTMPIASLTQVHVLAGRKAEAALILNTLRQLSKYTYASSYDLVVAYADLDERDQAFTWLEKAYQERSSWLALLAVDPRLDSLRSDPRFQGLFQRIGFVS